MPFADVPDFQTEAAQRYDSLWEGAAPDPDEIRAVCDEEAAIFKATSTAASYGVKGVESNYAAQLQYVLEQFGGLQKAIRSFRESRWSLVTLPSDEEFADDEHCPEGVAFTPADLPVLRRVLLEARKSIIQVERVPLQNGSADRVGNGESAHVGIFDREVTGPVDLAKVVATAVWSSIFSATKNGGADTPENWKIL